MNAYDIEVSSWFSINLLSPMAGLPAHGLAVATGDPRTMMHVFAAGDKSWNDGAIYRLAAVCSTLDISFLGLSLRSVKVVAADNKRQKEELQQKVKELVLSMKEEEDKFAALSSKVQAADQQWEELSSSINETHARLQQKLQQAEELAAAAAAAATDLANRQAAAVEKMELLQLQIKYLQLKLSESEDIARAEAAQQQRQQQQQLLQQQQQAADGQDEEEKEE
ncbi:hypothetical protein, conserved [Eimeria brunetti]|uniref:Uncharacterized protein n=1 Tax=Eimeria brunetti TaxID=51314 RepID=U6LR83_9EIME|nr:hypothetical protein, conserved [Eimeria brunetti]